MNLSKKLLFAAILAPLLGRPTGHAAEFEVLDRFSVDGYSVLKGSADIPGGSFTVGGSTFVVKGGNVGIGIADPFSKLSFGNSSVSNKIALYELATGNALRGIGMTSNGTAWGIGLWAIPTDIPPTISNAGLFLQDGGNIGIGTAGPTAKLTIGSNTSIQSASGLALGLDNNNIEYVASTAGSGYGFKIYGSDPGGGTYLRIAARANSTSWTDEISISDTVHGGSVGIGTVSPAASLHVVSTNTVSTAFKVQTGSIPGTEVIISTSGSLSVDGGIRVGTVTAGCTSAIAGTLRWYAGHMSVCNGSDWRQLDNQPPPTVSSVNPPSGIVTGGIPVTISGSGFNLGLEIFIDGIAATITGITGSQITAIAPASATGTGSKIIRISNPDGQYCAGAFTYNPFITTALPASGPQSTVITITGGGFMSSVGVKIGTLDATGIIRDSDTQIRATIPAGYLGGDVKDVTVINSDATSAVKSNGFTYKVYATGGDLTTPSGYRVHSFTTGTVDKTLVFTNAGNVEVLVVAGGGGGANTGSGGGGGGYYSNASFAVTQQSYTITVGDGGAGGSSIAAGGAKGADSIFSTITAEGGGAGVSHGGTAGGNGGSGGGGPIRYTGPAAPGGIGSQGHDGGTSIIEASWVGNCGGGGGAGATGTAGGDSPGTGTGGAGLANSITGSSVYYAGGGGGGEVNGSYAGSGGTGGGGTATKDAAGSNGAANTGGGGGGGSYTGTYFNGGNGGSGIVIIRYPE